MDRYPTYSSYPKFSSYSDNLYNMMMFLGTNDHILTAVIGFLIALAIPLMLFTWWSVRDEINGTIYNPLEYRQSTHTKNNNVRIIHPPATISSWDKLCKMANESKKTISTNNDK